MSLAVKKKDMLECNHQLQQLWRHISLVRATLYRIIFVDILTIPHRWTIARAGIQHRSIRSFIFVVHVLIKLGCNVYQQSIEATLQQLTQPDLVLSIPDSLSNVENVRLTVRDFTKYALTLSVSVANIVTISFPVRPVGMGLSGYFKWANIQWFKVGTVW